MNAWQGSSWSQWMTWTVLLVSGTPRWERRPLSGSRSHGAAGAVTPCGGPAHAACQLPHSRAVPVWGPALPCPAPARAPRRCPGRREERRQFPFGALWEGKAMRPGLTWAGRAGRRRPGRAGPAPSQPPHHGEWAGPSGAGPGRSGRPCPAGAAEPLDGRVVRARSEAGRSGAALGTGTLKAIPRRARTRFAPVRGNESSLLFRFVFRPSGWARVTPRAFLRQSGKQGSYREALFIKSSCNSRSWGAGRFQCLQKDRVRFRVHVSASRLTGGKADQCWGWVFLCRDRWEELFPRCIPCCQVSGELALQRYFQPGCLCTTAGSDGACWDLAAPFHQVIMSESVWVWFWTFCQSPVSLCGPAQGWQWRVGAWKGQQPSGLKGYGQDPGRETLRLSSAALVLVCWDQKGCCGCSLL